MPFAKLKFNSRSQSGSRTVKASVKTRNNSKYKHKVTLQRFKMQRSLRYKFSIAKIKSKPIYHYYNYPDRSNIGKVIRISRYLKNTVTNNTKNNYYHGYSLSNVLHCHRQFIVKIANDYETNKFFKLRSRVFGKEFQKHKIIFPNDKDYYDQHSKQIILLDTNLEKIVAGCRLIIDAKQDNYYSNTEFDLTDFCDLLDGYKMEISRVCVHPRYRNGVTIVMLWRGILSYAVENNIDYLFGMPSIKSTYHHHMKQFFDYCKSNNHVGQMFAKPREQYLNFHFKTPSFDISHQKSLKDFHRANRKDSSKSLLSVNDEIDLNFNEYNNKNNNEKNLPQYLQTLVTPLLMCYLKAGAKICSDGVVDHLMQCSDFFTVLKISDLHPRYKKFIKANAEKENK